MRLRFDGLGARARRMRPAARTRPGRSRAATPSPRRCGPSASDMGVEFSRAIVVSRTRSDANVYDVTTKVDVDATLVLPRRRVPALRGPHRRTRQGPDLDRFRALPGGGAEGGARLGRGEKPRRAQGHERGRARVPRRLPPARRRLCRGQDRGARAGRRVARADGDRFGPDLRHRRAGRRIGRSRPWASSASITSSGAGSTRRCPTCSSGSARRAGRVVVRARLGGDGRGAQRPAVDL